MLGLRFCARAFSSCGKRGPLFIAVRGPLTVVASPLVEHRLQTRRLSSCGPRAQLLRGMWDLPRPGLEPVSPALAGRFSTTAPPGKPLMTVFIMNGCWVLSNAFSMSIEMILWFLSFFLLMWHITLICICWTILALEWIQVDRGLWSFLCIVGFSFLIFCGGFLHLYSSKILAVIFFFVMSLVLVSWPW